MLEPSEAGRCLCHQVLEIYSACLCMSLSIHSSVVCTQSAAIHAYTTPRPEQLFCESIRNWSGFDVWKISTPEGFKKLEEVRRRECDVRCVALGFGLADSCLWFATVHLPRWIEDRRKRVVGQQRPFASALVGGRSASKALRARALCFELSLNALGQSILEHFGLCWHSWTLRLS